MKSLYLNIDNQTLVQECRSGDRDAMSILYTRFAPRMLRVISRYVNDKDCAQDILHDGFIAAFTRLDTLRDPENLDFWLATIMKNLSLKFLQAQTISSILDEIPETIDEPDIVQVLDFEILESLIRQLPDGYQKVFRLAVLEGKSHKEISEILGIAPNSSSSQLFHAKLRLRELIKDYQLRAGLLSFLLLLVSVGILFFSRHDFGFTPTENLTTEATPEQSENNPVIVSARSATAGLKTSVTPHATSALATNPGNLIAASTSGAAPTYRILTPSEAAETDTSLEETGIASAPTTTPEDSVAQSPADTAPEVKPYAPYQADSFDENDLFLAEAVTHTKKNKDWSMAISVDPGLASFDGRGAGDAYGIGEMQPGPGSDQNPGDTPDESEPSEPARSPRFRSMSSPEDYLSSNYFSRRHYLPVSFALTAEKRFSSWLGVESGLGYSYLHTDYERNTLHSTEVATCHWHYLEIPLKVNLYAYTSPRFKLYASLGGRVAIPIYSYASIPSNPYCQSGRFGSKAVWSVGGSVGAAFRLSKRVDLFIEPSLRYHFPQDCLLPNIWTDDTPWSFSLPLGFRLSW